MKKLNNQSKVLYVFYVVAAVFMFVSAGRNMEQLDHFSASIALAAGAFFVAILFATVRDYVKEVEDRSLADLRAEQTVDDMMNLFIVCNKLGLAEKGPQPSNYEQIQDEFHNRTGRYVRMIDAGDGKFSTKFGVVMPEAPAEQPESDTPAATAVPARHIPVEGAKRSETPARQRKRNEKAGKGAFTDAELKQQANEKRRQARLAKKAAAQPKAEPTLKDKIDTEAAPKA